jgi:hypothetical protein
MVKTLTRKTLACNMIGKNQGVINYNIKRLSDNR